jgi:hypothetical protein
LETVSGLEVSLVGQNLLENNHAEFGQAGSWVDTAYTPRGVYVKMKWSFGE